MTEIAAKPQNALASFRPSSVLLNFKFMKHDRWDKALFLHWKVPKHLEKILEDNTHPFVLDRYSDGSYYIGLILLTEQAVGPAIGRSKWTTVDHHGVNVRTYVRGTASSPPGIHFSSLECNDEFTSWGANWFGMPYQVAEIKRTFGNENGKDIENDDTQQPTSFRLTSKRYSLPKPSMLRLLGEAVRSIYRRNTADNDDGDTETTDTFSVDCSWSRCDKKGPNKAENDQKQDDKDFATWVVERYFVYTHRYGLNWSGQVEHKPWPLENVQLDHLTITGIDSYEPSRMRPILQHMADHPPDSVLFSPRVGPVLFNMLRPV